MFTELNRDSHPNFEFIDLNEDLTLEEHLELGYYIEKDQYDLDLLEVEIKIYILNDGDNEIEVPSEAIWLNITHIDKNGDTVNDADITPIRPKSSALIEQAQKKEFTFSWEPGEQVEKLVTYDFQVTVDPEKKLYETKDIADNSAEFQLTINKLEEPKQSPDDIDTEIIGIVLIIMVVIIIVVVGMFRILIKKKPVNE